MLKRLGIGKVFWKSCGLNCNFEKLGGSKMKLGKLQVGPLWRNGNRKWTAVHLFLDLKFKLFECGLKGSLFKGVSTLGF